MTAVQALPPAVASAPPRSGSAVLVSGCDGYAAGTAGIVTGWKEGCVVFVPDHPERVARWARRRTSLVVPVGLLAIYR